MLWTCVVARSGAAKSPALRAATRYFVERERELVRANGEAEAKFEHDHRKWDGTDKKIRGEPPQRPPRLTCLLDDLTLAVVAPILGANPHGALVVKDEMSAWFGFFGQFGKSPAAASADVSGWLSLHNGERLILDRKTNGESHRIFHPRLSITGCITPGVLQRTLTRDFFERGLPARILFAAPPASPNVWSDTEVPEDLDRAAGEIFSRLFTLKATPHLDGPVPSEIELSPEALAVYVAHHDRVAHMAVETDERSGAAWSKLTGGAARLALVGHLAHGLDGSPVGPEIMTAAVNLAAWFGSEAERIYAGAAIETPEAAERRKLVEFVRSRGGEVTVRDLTRDYRPLKDKSGEAEAALIRLVSEERGEWTPLPATASGRPPARRFRLFRNGNAVDCRHNAGVMAENVNCVDSRHVDTAGNEGVPGDPADQKPVAKPRRLVEEYL